MKKWDSKISENIEKSKIKSVHQKKIEIHETRNCETKVRVEIYRTLFAKLIVKRKMYLKHIQNQGAQITVPHVYHHAASLGWLSM